MSRIARKYGLEGITLRDQFHLTHQEFCFIVHYVKDNSPRRAAEAAGWSADYGYKVREREHVDAAIVHVLATMLDDALPDAEALAWEMYDNVIIGRQTGNLAASNTALNMLAKHKKVDAYAADKIKVTTDADVVDRMVAGRLRALGQVDEEDKEPKQVSFL